MKKLIVALLALLLASVLWWSSPAPLQSASAASAMTDQPAPVAAVADGPRTRADDTGARSDATERTLAAQPVGSLRMCALVLMQDAPLMGGLLVLVQVWPGKETIVPFEGLVHTVTTSATDYVRLSGLAPGVWQVKLVASPDDGPWPVQIDADAEAEIYLSPAAVATARGIVVDADGLPVPDAELWVHRGTYMGRYSTPEPQDLCARLAGLSDAGGRFTVALAPMESRIAASRPGYGESLGRYVTADRGELRLVLGRETAAVSGTVRDHAGNLAGSTLVHLTPPGQDSRRAADGTLLAERVGRLTRTGPDGRFAFAGLAPGKQRIWASVAGSFALRELEVNACQSPEIELQLSNNVVVMGTVRYADGSPARVGLHSTPERNLNGHYCHCETREDGSYYLYYQPRRPFFVMVGSHAQTLAEREFANPEAGTIRCDFVLDRLVTVHGRLIDADGNPVARWSVMAKDGRDRKAYGSTDQAGAFRIVVAPDQSFTLIAFPPDGREDAPAVVHSVPRADREGIELLVPAATMPSARVRGRLVGPDQGGLAGRKLAVQCSDGRWLKSYKTATTAADGRFAFDGLSPGAFDLVLAKQDDEGSTLAKFTLAHGQRLALGELVVEPPAVLQMEVTRADGSDWHGAWPYAVLYDAAGRRADFETSPCNTGIRLLAAAGSYRVEITGTDLIAAPQQVELQAGQCSNLRLPVGIGRSRTLVCNGDGRDKPDLGTQLHLVVRGADGAMIVQRDVTDLYPDLRGFRYWYLDHVFAFGRYAVEASTDGGLRYGADFEVRENLEDPTRIDVPLARQ